MSLCTQRVDIVWSVSVIADPYKFTSLDSRSMRYLFYENLILFHLFHTKRASESKSITDRVRIVVYPSFTYVPEHWLYTE